jgi:hypothetical protein
MDGLHKKLNPLLAGQFTPPGDPIAAAVQSMIAMRVSLVDGLPTMCGVRDRRRQLARSI